MNMNTLMTLRQSYLQYKHRNKHIHNMEHPLAVA